MYARSIVEHSGRAFVLVWEIIMSHMGIAPRNIILDATEDETWLIDWGAAGVYPHSFEIAALTMQSDFRDFTEELLARPKKYVEEVEILDSLLFALTPPPTCSTTT